MSIRVIKFERKVFPICKVLIYKIEVKYIHLLEENIKSKDVIGNLNTQINQLKGNLR